MDHFQIQEFFSYCCGKHIGNLSANIKALLVKDNDNYWATNDLSLQSAEVKRYYKIRQIIKVFFKILKSELRLESCSSRDRVAQINHIYFVLNAFCRLESFRIMKSIDTIYKTRLCIVCMCSS